MTDSPGSLQRRSVYRGKVMAGHPQIESFTAAEQRRAGKIPPGFPTNASMAKDLPSSCKTTTGCNMDAAEAKRLVASNPHWHHSFEIFDGVMTPGSYNPGALFDALNLPPDLSGKRVLDIGPSDGFFSMQLARRGAKVTAIDYRGKHSHGFAAMEAITGLSFIYRQQNIYDIKREDVGGFDVVLCLGLLYHLPDMMRAVCVLRELCDGQLFLETECEPDLAPEHAVARYYEAATLANDRTNFWAPNPECVRAMLRDTGFAPETGTVWGRRFIVRAEVAARTEKMKWAYGML